MNDLCIMCGAVVPEGRFICFHCEKKTEQIVSQTVSRSNNAKERVQQELLDLLDKRTKLNSFMQTEGFQKLDINSSRLLVMQSHIMSSYIGVLLARLESWKE